MKVIDSVANEAECYSKLFGSDDWVIPKRTVGWLAETDAIIIIVELGILAGYAIWLAVTSVAGAFAAVGLLVAGALALPLWPGVVPLAIPTTLSIELMKWEKDIARISVFQTMLASALYVLLGGFLLRMVITIDGQI